MASTSVNYILKIVDMISSPVGKITGKVGNLSDKLERLMKNSSSTFAMNQTVEGLQNVEQALNTITGPSIAFGKEMAELSAITGVTGAALDEISDKARQTAVAFGLDASASVQSYTRILSALGPDIAKSPQALDAMGKSVAILAKTMRGDSVGAADALTAAMNQYNVNLTDPIAASKSMAKMMDIMAAGAQAGNAEVSDIAASIKVSGLAAKNAGLGFEEYVATLEVLAKGNLKGAESGTALRNVLAIMSKENFLEPKSMEVLKSAGVDVSKLADTSSSLVERLRELSKVQGNQAGIAQIFGLENKNAAMLLLQNIPLIEKYTGLVGQNGTALDMVNKIMSSQEEHNKRLGAQMRDFAISVGNSVSKYQPFLSTTVAAIQLSQQLRIGFGFLGSGITSLYKKLFIGAEGQKSFAASIWGSIRATAIAAFQWGVNATKALGQFIISVATGKINILALGRTMVVNAAKSVKSFVISMAQGAGAMIKSGGAALWTAGVALVSYIGSLNLATIATGVFNSVLSANPIGAIIIGIMALVGLGYLIYKFWDDIVEFMTGIFEKIPNPFSFLIGVVDSIFPGFKEAMSGLFDWVLGMFESLWGGIKKVWDFIVDLFGGSEIDVKAPELEGGVITYDTNGNPITTDSEVDSQNKGTKSEGGGGSGKIVTIQNINIAPQITVKETLNLAMKDIREMISREIVNAVRDAEIIASN